MQVCQSIYYFHFSVVIMDKPIFLCSKFKWVVCDLFNKFKGGLVHKGETQILPLQKGGLGIKGKMAF